MPSNMLLYKVANKQIREYLLIKYLYNDFKLHVSQHCNYFTSIDKLSTY